MKVRKYFLILFATTFAINIHAAREATGAHMFGFSTSFNDSTVYITEIQYVDSAYIGKSKFLFSRENYSYQLQNYLRTKGVRTPTCVTIFAKDQKKIEKKYLSMRKKYEKNSKYNVRYITASDFRFNGVAPQASDLENEKTARKEAKEARKVAKQAKKKAKRKQKLAEKGIIEPVHPASQNTDEK